MSLTFYYGSGSPYAWKVWLALEHKKLDYEWKLLTFDRGETRTPEYLAINPRGKVPVLVHDGLVIAESNAIVEYLEERFPDSPLLPRDISARAKVRQLAAEADGYIAPVQRKLFQETLFTKEEARDATKIAEAHAAILEELARWEARLTGDWLAGDLSLADFATYPHVRAIRRVDDRLPAHGLGDLWPARITAWMKRIEALPYYEKTIPPHWKG
ncbi:glutathione S-transferase family protein [Polyangium sp. y55x31]|uniref:glutathione S-transferase family protein n=1 Tax=Polyangium sp. y55x31 TaxID=3042688 RepID=UPI002482904A|nr:glutathione S-transferase family protein [Polyangium sp. y55x31]MDI1479665.1 glutathione S-transferase family protein [Polyangium sp. y55x31]